jgi:hypothetical protein
METVNPVLKRHITQVIENQIREKDPPETKEVYDRLRREGRSAEEAHRLLGCVLIAEIYEIEKEKRVFDLELYVKRLKALPRLPWE